MGRDCPGHEEALRKTLCVIRDVREVKRSRPRRIKMPDRDRTHACRTLSQRLLMFHLFSSNQSQLRL